MTQDKDLLKNRFAANFRTYNALAVVQEDICRELAGIMARHILAESVGRGFEFGAGTGFLTRRLLELYPCAAWTVNDLAEESRPFIEKYAAGKDVDYLWGDAENAALPSCIDLAASASTMQWFDDIPRFIVGMGGKINQGGYLAVTSFGPENFREIKAVTGEGLEYYDIKELREMFTGAGFETVESNEYTKRLLFETPRDVLRHIKATGVNSIRPVRWNKRRLAEFEESYYRNFPVATDAGTQVSLTYHPVIILAQKQKA